MIAFITYLIAVVILVSIEERYLAPVGSSASSRPYCALGDHYMLAGQYDMAREYYTLAANGTPMNYAEHAKALNNLAALCYLNDENGRAKVYIRQAIAMAPRVKHFYLTQKSIEGE